MSKYTQIVIDLRSQTCEITPGGADDTLLTSNTADMNDAGMKIIQCTREDREFSKSETGYMGNKFEHGLYDRLIEEYRSITGKRLNKW